MKYRPLGDLRLRRVVESIWSADVGFFFEETPREFWVQHLDWLAPDSFDPQAWRLRMPMQSYIVQTPHHNILIDTCVGGNKHLPHYPEWHQNDHRQYQENLAAHGLTFEDIDFVMCTHLHPITPAGTLALRTDAGSRPLRMPETSSRKRNTSIGSGSPTASS